MSYKYFSFKAHFGWKYFKSFFKQPGVKGCPEVPGIRPLVPGIEPLTLRFAA